MFLDIAFGIFSSYLISYWFNLDFNYQIVILGIVFSLLPDLDIFLGRGINGKQSHRHRDYLHFPVVFLILAVIIWFWSHPLGLLFALASLLHFLHDSVGIGWGVKWLWPFSSRQFKFFTTKENQPSFHPLVFWDSDELSAYVERYGEDNWFQKYYLSFHPLGVFELFIFILSVILFIYEVS